MGCPQRLAVRQGDSTGPHPTSILGMAADPTGAYIAILTRHDLQVRGFMGSTKSIVKGLIARFLRMFGRH